MSGEAQNSSHVLPLIPAFLLGTLDSVEKLQVSSHLQTCRECAAECQAYEKVMDNLFLAAPQVNPPPRLRESILRQARRSHPLVAEKITWWRDLYNLIHKPGLAYMAASLGVILLLAVGNLYQWRYTSQRAEPTPVAYNFGVITMVGTDPAAKAEGILVISPDGRYGTLVVDGLAPLVADREYQLWLIVGESRVSGGVFSVGASGYGTMKVESPRPLSEYSQFGITIEPIGGSQQPTGERVLGGGI